MKFNKWYAVKFISTVVFLFIIFGYREGPAYFAGYDCTGAETGLSNPTGCYAFSGCHHSSPTSAIGLTLELDSAGTPVLNYVGGMSYTIKINGVNNSIINLPKFGFQIGAIKGSIAQVTPVNAGTFASPYPVNTHYSAPVAGYYVVGVVEQGAPLSPSSGTGGIGTTYNEVINWIAPVKGTGTISIWAALNAVNNNGIADTNDHWNVSHLVIGEELINGINELSGNGGLKIYPNPFTSFSTFYFVNEITNGQLLLFNSSGMEVKNFTFSGNKVIIDRNGLSSGMYFYRIILKDEKTTLAGKLLVY